MRPGFPYRGLLFLPDRGCYLGELSDEETARLSQRRAVLVGLRADLPVARRFALRWRRACYSGSGRANLSLVEARQVCQNARRFTGQNRCRTRNGPLSHHDYFDAHRLPGQRAELIGLSR